MIAKAVIKTRAASAALFTTGPIGGWAFENENAWYPDVDDTAMVLLALRHVKLSGPLKLAREKAFLRGINWLMSMQSSNGGWAAFDIDNTKAIFTYIPFADHNAMIDPSTPDITARVLEMLGQFGYGVDHPAVRRAVDFVRARREPDGAWYGRWGVNYIYGTWQALVGLDRDRSRQLTGSWHHSRSALVAATPADQRRLGGVGRQL